MFGDIALFLLNVVFTLFGAALVLRTWVQAIRLPPYNPISQALFQFTDWLVRPLRRVVPGWRGIDWAPLLGAWLAAILYLVLMFTLYGADPRSLFPGVLLAALLTVAKWAVNLLLWTTIILALMSWLSPGAPAMMLLDALVSPLLRPIRRVLPTMGGFDLSPLVLVVLAQLVLIVLTRLTMMALGAPIALGA